MTCYTFNKQFVENRFFTEKATIFIVMLTEIMKYFIFITIFSPEFLTKFNNFLDLPRKVGYYFSCFYSWTLSSIIFCVTHQNVRFSVTSAPSVRTVFLQFVFVLHSHTFTRLLDEYLGSRFTFRDRFSCPGCHLTNVHLENSPLE